MIEKTDGLMVASEGEIVFLDGFFFPDTEVLLLGGHPRRAFLIYEAERRLPLWSSGFCPPYPPRSGSATNPPRRPVCPCLDIHLKSPQAVRKPGPGAILLALPTPLFKRKCLSERTGSIRLPQYLRHSHCLNLPMTLGR